MRHRLRRLLSTRAELVAAAALALPGATIAADEASVAIGARTSTTVAAAMTEGHLRATDLRCEWTIDPVGVGDPAPRLKWIVESSRRAERQSAYRILVASTRALLDADEGDRWDSGVVESRSSHAVYAGDPLASGAICHWKVLAWDRDGVAGPWSEPARWEMGLMDEGAWSAAWVDAAPMPRTPAGKAPDPLRVRRALYLPATADFDATAEALARAAGGRGAPEGAAGHRSAPRSGVPAADVTAIVAERIKHGEAILATNAALGGDPAPGVVKRLVVEFEQDGALLRREAREQGTLRLVDSALPLLRRDFALERPVRSARLHATALGLYEVWINGERVGDLALAPGWTDYRKRVDRQMYDVTSLLREGPNTIGAVVGPGWFSGRAGLFHAQAFYGSAPAFACQLELEFDDGSTRRIETDGEWRRRPGPTLAADLMDGETYDARAAIPGWCEPASGSTADGEWVAVLVRDEARHLESSIDHTVRTLMELPAVRVSEPAPGRYVFDLGQNMVGVVRLRLREPAGTVVTLRHAEILSPDGTIDTSNLRGAAATDAYICRGPAPVGAGDGWESWQPSFTFHGFRYVELSGLSAPVAGARTTITAGGSRTLPPLSTVTGIVIGSDLPQTMTFRCSDEALTQLHSNILWGLRGNAVSIPTDCPQRDERMGWSGDVQVFAPTGTLIADMGLFLEKWLVDLDDAQRPDGAHSDVAPVMHGLSFGSPGWADAGTIVPWTLYRRTGDLRILDRHIAGMTRWVDWCERHSEGLLRRRSRGNDYGDWLAVDAPTSKELLGTAYFAQSADCTAKALRALGRDDEAARYEGLLQRIRDAFAAAYIGIDGRIAGETQTAYALALRFDLVPSALREQAVGHLVDAIAQRQWRLSTGFLGSGHLLPALDDGGRPDVALRLLVEREWPSWLFPVQHGATTIWERWDGWTPQRGAHPDVSMNSFNHFAFGSCGEWLYGGVAGVAQAPDDIGFEHILVRPRTEGPIEWSEAEFTGVRGTISTAWRRRGPARELEVTIPANAIATVVLPAAWADELRESGLALDEAEGVALVERRDDEVILRLGSGRYRFTGSVR
ncbi:MAG TPA: family 78 glycoside hydrolase catalytic domain [Phycisphaerales bacterium]|nr:family 78 glycoside hydrolase catalytic domain [Phycisphaerales bacterium]HMP36926.1 family 78 glycoside hydrolase catalytic domain [Phycisphaerales bacterium]